MRDGRVVLPPDPELDDMFKTVGSQRRREILAARDPVPPIGRSVAKAAALESSQFSRWMQQLVRAGVVDQIFRVRSCVYRLSKQVSFTRRHGDLVISVNVGELSMKFKISPEEVRAAVESLHDLLSPNGRSLRKMSPRRNPLAIVMPGGSRRRTASAPSPPRRSTSP